MSGKSMTVSGVSLAALLFCAGCASSTYTFSQPTYRNSQGYPVDAKAWRADFEGCKEFDAGQYDSAITNFTEAITIEPTYADAYYYRGLALQQLGKYEQAIADYTKAIGYTDHNAEDYVSRGAAFMELGKNEEAIADETKALDKESPNQLWHFEDAYVIRGFAFNKLGKYEQAIADYTSAIEFKPDSPDSAFAYRNRGIAFKKLGKNEQAVADNKKAIELDPKMVGNAARGDDVLKAIFKSLDEDNTYNFEEFEQQQQNKAK